MCKILWKQRKECYYLLPYRWFMVKVLKFEIAWAWEIQQNLELTFLVSQADRFPKQITHKGILIYLEDQSIGIKGQVSSEKKCFLGKQMHFYNQWSNHIVPFLSIIRDQVEKKAKSFLGIKRSGISSIRLLITYNINAKNKTLFP